MKKPVAAYWAWGLNEKFKEKRNFLLCLAFSLIGRARHDGTGLGRTARRSHP